MLVRQLAQEPSAGAQVLDDRLIRLLYEGAVPRRAAGQPAARVHELNEGQIPGAADPAVVFTEGGSEVDDAGAVRQRDVAVRNDAPALFALMVDGEIEEGLI